MAATPSASVSALPREPDLDAVRSRVDQLFDAQKAFFRSGATLSRAFREEQLRGFLAAMSKHEARILDALREDLHRSKTEAYLTEVGYVTGEIRHTLKHLGGWMTTSGVVLPPGRGALAQLPAPPAAGAQPHHRPLELPGAARPGPPGRGDRSRQHRSRQALGARARLVGGGGRDRARHVLRRPRRGRRGGRRDLARPCWPSPGTTCSSPVARRWERSWPGPRPRTSPGAPWSSAARARPS